MKYNAILLTISVAAPIAWAQADVPLPPDDASQKKIVADVAARALQYSKELPEFACEVVTRRNLDPTGSRQHWRISETVHEELTFSGNKEDYKTLSANGKRVAAMAARPVPSPPATSRIWSRGFSIPNIRPK